ncbi:hypothetical protein OIDMADRAFT_58551 [Oidiodendron maius Zn]|uniref:Uncharacterized protein n=1 Tax=Oidiodendron maius (strain Zn) TaxID=913774 RepID=A0A0C3H385_OIDMZ|nr:hypothetical protein OIDMADRAFT_58551 [Oidiodendron maius Zn]
MALNIIRENTCTQRIRPHLSVDCLKAELDRYVIAAPILNTVIFFGAWSRVFTTDAAPQYFHQNVKADLARQLTAKRAYYYIPASQVR